MLADGWWNGCADIMKYNTAKELGRGVELGGVHEVRDMKKWHINYCTESVVDHDSALSRATVTCCSVV